MTADSEKTYFEGGPAKSDLLINLLAGITLIGLPFTFGAIVRALWVRFHITNKRISVTGGWLGRDQTQIVFSQISEIRSVPRGLGLYGDMVIFLKDGAKLEMRSVPNFRETEDYILKKINLQGQKASSQSNQGFG